MGKAGLTGDDYRNHGGWTGVADCTYKVPWPIAWELLTRAALACDWDRPTTLPEALCAKCSTDEFVEFEDC